MHKRPISIVSINGSVNADSLSWKANHEVVEHLTSERENCHLTVIDLNDTMLVKRSLNANNFKKFYQDVDSDYFIDLLKETDLLVINTPMINFTYSPLIKNFIDAISIADKTFSYKYSNKGDAIGLLSNLKVIIIGTQGAPKDWYPFTNHISNLEGIFKFLGANQVETYLIEGTKVSPKKDMTHEEILKAIDNDLKELANKIN
ncbi:FMN-dependent NADH-azoreductase [Mycoplasmopsis iners]|uniref:FMN-dependent NADH-azoreductase n=1 Tax=Mycoplasmopsis iners TaxID=76630 RepID=UPI0004974D7C|nr:FMN-dependent NADH-azoreductase [Mycoplasmopsis iners]